MPTGPIKTVAVDPQGRYLIDHDLEGRTAVQLDLNPPGGGQPTGAVILTAATDAVLDQVSGMDLFDFENEGRKIFMRRRYPHVSASVDEVRTIVPDTDNDGIFELARHRCS